MIGTHRRILFSGLLFNRWLRGIPDRCSRVVVGGEHMDTWREFGAAMVGALVGSPVAAGLFGRAIAQSGAWMGLGMEAMMPRARAEEAPPPPLPSLAELRARSSEEVVRQRPQGHPRGRGRLRVQQSLGAAGHPRRQFAGAGTGVRTRPGHGRPDVVVLGEFRPNRRSERARPAGLAPLQRPERAAARPGRYRGVSVCRDPERLRRAVRPDPARTGRGPALTPCRAVFLPRRRPFCTVGPGFSPCSRTRCPALPSASRRAFQSRSPHSARKHMRHTRCDSPVNSWRDKWQ